MLAGMAETAAAFAVVHELTGFSGTWAHPGSQDVRGEGRSVAPVRTLLDDRGVDLPVMRKVQPAGRADEDWFVAIEGTVHIAIATGLTLTGSARPLCTFGWSDITLNRVDVQLFPGQTALGIAHDLGRKSSLPSAKSFRLELVLAQALVAATGRAVLPCLVGIVQVRLVQPAGLTVTV
jgi:hypothetical protein